MPDKRDKKGDGVALRARDELDLPFPPKQRDWDEQGFWIERGKCKQVAIGIVGVIVVSSVIVAIVTSLTDQGTGIKAHLPIVSKPAANPNWQGPSTVNWRGQATDDWQGYKTLKGGKGYARTPMGQVHYRDVGPRNYKQPPVMLLHQGQMSMIQWGAVQNELTAMGIRSIAIDTPGSGLSDLPPQQPTIPEIGDNLIPVLNHLQLKNVVIAGHHTGASIACAFAANHRDRVAAIVMHGVQLWDQGEIAGPLVSVRTRFAMAGADIAHDAEFAALLASVRGPEEPRTPVSDGSHFTSSFLRTNTTSPSHLMALTHMVVSKFQQGPTIGSYAARAYTMKSDLRAIRCPGLILSDVSDILHPMATRARNLRPDFEYVEFSNASATGAELQQSMEPQRWASVLRKFLKSLA